MYKEKVSNLMHAIVNSDDNAEDKKMDLEFVESRMSAFTDYVAHVAWMETRIQRLNIEGVRGEEWRDAVTNLDSQRRSKHDVAIGAINQLNRMSQAHGLEPFYDGPTDNEHRTEVGDAIGNIVNEYFEGRTGGKLKAHDLLDEDDFTKAVAEIPDLDGGDLGK